MADAAVSILVKPMISIIGEWLKEEISLVMGVKEELKNLSSKLKTIQNVLTDAEERSVKEAIVQDWLEKLKYIAYDVDDVLDEWNTATSNPIFGEAEKQISSCSSSLFTACFSPFKQVGLRHDIASKIKEINETLDSVIREINDFGFGGLGKTTLAKLVYNNDVVVKKFSKRIWVCVSNPFDIFRVAAEIVEAIDERPPEDRSLDRLLTHLKESISNEKFLLVLDDVWDEEGKKWEDLRNCLEHGVVGSRILVTTRNETVAEMMGTNTTNLHHLGKLSEEACWSLFSRIAFGKEEKNKNLTEIGRDIVKKCNGLPLAIRTLASLLCKKKTQKEWELVLHSEIWNLEKAEVELFPQLYLSYIELPPLVKRCFSYCSIFPKDTRIIVDELIQLWMAQGYITSGDIGENYMELKGREYFDKLAMCCFFQDFENDALGNLIACKMHDILHDFAQYLTRNECITIANVIPNTFSEKTRHLTLLPSPETESPHDVGKLRTFFAKQHSLDQPDDLFNHLRCVRVLVLSNCDLKKLPENVESLVRLRYLDLSSNTDLDELPESMCELYNLQTLSIAHCYKLSRLPQTIGKLRNLRHLLITKVSLRQYPKSFEKLTNLRVLTKFVVGRTLGKLEYLKHFKHLGGSLEIEFNDDLGVADIVADAEKAQLKNKKYIHSLTLIMLEVQVGTLAVWEALQPPPNIEFLKTVGMFGTQWPSWFMKSDLDNLKKLSISDFPNWSTLPPLGKLPNLETLIMYGNGSIKHIGRGFLGIEEEEEAAITPGLRRAAAPSSNSLVCVFPKLVYLKIWRFFGWQEWEELNQEDYDEQGIHIMPRLRELWLESCPKLKQLPDRLLRKASSLQYLDITGCGIFGDNGDTESRGLLIEQLLSHIPKIAVDDVTYTRDNPTGMLEWEE